MIGIAPIAGTPAQMPFLRFETRAIEKRKTVEEGGSVYYENVDFALVTAHGSKDTVEKVVSEWLARLEVEVRDSRLPQQWLDHFKATYSAWKTDQAPPLIGTDIRTWPAISPAECKRLVDLRCMTIEALAAANEELIQRYGMGGRALSQKAQTWLAAQKDHGPIVDRIAALEASQEGLKAQIEHWRGKAIAAEGALRTAQAMVPFAPMQAGPALPPEPPDNTAALIADGIEETFGKASEAEDG